MWEIEIERNKKPFQEFQMQTSSKKLKVEKKNLEFKEQTYWVTLTENQRKNENLIERQTHKT